MHRLTKTTTRLNLKLLRHPPGLVGAILACLFFATSLFANDLADHPSAYIAQHAKDPINWHLWQRDTLKIAQQQNKLIFISSGYFACHWCHVMHQENYSDTHVGQLLNQHFISVKVDRELNPNLDNYLLTFARRTTGRAGWPLHVILTPNGYPLAAFVYLPRDNLLQTLNQLQNWWQTEANHLNDLAQKDWQSPQLAKIERDLLGKKILSELDLDVFSGGLNASQKFPNSPLLKTLLNQSNLSKEREDWLILTLEQMQNTHLYDHIHQGFFRYTVDPNWLEPHFEKMLYDNAQLAEIFLIAARRWSRTDFLQTAQNTLQYIHTELYNPITGLARASQSTLDQDGVDGGRYLWSLNALQATLNKTELNLLTPSWQLNQAPPFSNGWLPKPLNQINNQTWLLIQSKLKRPAITDDKQLLGWNGLWLSALAEAYRQTREARYLRQGHSLALRLIDLLHQPNPPRAITDKGQAIGQATLEDYAYVLRGLKAWQQTTNFELSDIIQTLQNQAKTQFYSADRWYTSLDNLLPNQDQKQGFPDTATPSPTALLHCPDSVFVDLALPLWHYASYLICEQ